MSPTATHALVPIQGTVSATLFDQRLNQTDLRFSKNIKVGRGKVQGILDLYNVFNASDATTLQETFDYATNGATYLRPTAIVAPRFARINVTVNF